MYSTASRGLRSLRGPEPPRKHAPNPDPHKQVQPSRIVQLFPLSPAWWPPCSVLCAGNKELSVLRGLNNQLAITFRASGQDTRPCVIVTLAVVPWATSLPHALREAIAGVA